MADKAVQHIYATKDYDKFKTLFGNRDADKYHIQRLEASHKEFAVLAAAKPVVVNEKFEIIDGQHTFWARQDLGVEIYYTIAEGAMLPDVQILNTLFKPWQPIDFAKSYAKVGRKPYIFYLDIRQRYNLSHRAALIFMRAETKGSAHTNGAFRKGLLQLPETEEVVEKLNLLQDVRRFFPYANHAPGFARAFHKVVEHPDYDHRIMIAQAEKQGHTVKNYARTEDFLRAFEDVYNYANGSRNKIRFDYKGL